MNRRRSFVLFETIPVGNGVLASEPGAPHRPPALDGRCGAGHRRHPGAQHGNQRRCSLASRPPESGVPENARHPVCLILLHVDEEHVGHVVAQLEREGRQQIRLHRMHADDEEAAEPHREKDYARLVAWTAQIQGGVAQREPVRRLQRARQPDQRPAQQVQRPGHEDESTRHVGADLEGRGLPGGYRHEPQADQYRRGNADPVGGQRSQRLALPQQQQGLGVTRIEQGHQGEQQRHEQSDRQPLQHRRRGQVGRDHLEAGGRRRLRRQRLGHGRQHSPGDADPEQRPSESQQGHLHHIDGQHIGSRGAEALQDRGATEPLLHEDARHAPDADAAENHDDEPDQAEVVLRPREMRSIRSSVRR